jgi:helicase
MIPVLEVRQMCGRAGRPRYDKYGEAILVARDDEEKSILLDTYLLGDNEEIRSKLGTEPAIRSHVLALIATKIASSRDDLREFFEKTFLAHQTDTAFLEEMIYGVVEFLQKEKMVIEGELLKATAFGKSVSDLYIDPKSAVVIRDALGAYRTGKTFGILHAICATPDMPLLYLRQSDYDWIEEFESSVSENLLIEPPSDLARYEIFLAEVKTAKLLSDWMSETPENDIAEAFGVGPGDIRNKMDIAEWLIHSAARISGLFNKDAVTELEELRTRARYGIGTELLDLVKLRGVGRVRARALYNRGYRTTQDLRLTSYDRLKQVPTIGEAVARSIKDQLGQSEPGIPVQREKDQMSLKDYR